MTEQLGIVVTSSGVLFLSTGDGKRHVQGEMNGRVLWTTDHPARSRSIPAMYEFNGKAYLVISASSPATPREWTCSKCSRPAPDFHRAYVTFSLPEIQVTQAKNGAKEYDAV